MKEWLSHRGRPILFSTALPTAAIGAVIDAFKILNETTEYTERLWSNARFFKDRLGRLGFDTGHSQTPITPVIIGDEAKTMAFSRKLMEKGVFASGIVFPTVPTGTGRVRCMVTAAHTEAQLERAVDAFKEAGEELNIL